MKTNNQFMVVIPNATIDDWRRERDKHRGRKVELINGTVFVSPEPTSEQWQVKNALGQILVESFGE